jgi:PAS domain S-box-containing protein
MKDSTPTNGTIRFGSQSEEEVEMFKAIAEQAVHGSAISDLAGKIIYVNDAFANLHGYTREELTGKHFSVFHNESQLTHALKLINQMKCEGSYPPTEVWHVHRDGRKFPMLMSGSVIKDYTGDIKYLSASGVDISELIQAKQKLETSEQKYRYIADNIYDGILIINSENRIKYVSPSYLKLMGRSEKEELSFGYDDIFELVHPDDREQVFPKIFSAIETKKKSVTYTYRALRKDGKYVWREDNSSLNYDKSGNFLGSITICRDISERKKVEQELIRAKEKAEENDRFKTAFLQNISHEIRTPMNGILGFMDLINQGDLCETEKTPYVESIKTSARRLINTMEDIIKISEIETGQAEINIQVVDTLGILEEQYEAFHNAANNKNIAFTMSQTVKPEDSLIMSNSSTLSDILSKLLNNAFKFSKEGYVDFGNFLDKGQMVFYVKDSGVGIPKDDHERIFERFVQADMRLTRSYEGSGLGLSLAKAYVSMLGGEIWLESEPNKGTTFFFSFPHVRNMRETIETNPQ